MEHQLDMKTLHVHLGAYIERTKEMNDSTKTNEMVTIPRSMLEEIEKLHSVAISMTKEIASLKEWFNDCKKQLKEMDKTLDAAIDQQAKAKAKAKPAKAKAKAK